MTVLSQASTSSERPIAAFWKYFSQSRGMLALAQLLIAVTGLSAWQILSQRFSLEFWVSSPISVAVEMERWASSGLMMQDVGTTLFEAGLGFLIGSVVGGIVGFMLGWVRWLGNLLEPFILTVYTIPKIALAPLFVLWFGIGPFTKVMLAALVVFFMVFFTTFQGTRQVDRDLVENARLLGARRFSIWTKIAIPYSAVWMFSGIRIGLPYALIGAIVGEFIASDAGVGYRIKEASAYFNTSGVFAGIIVLMVISSVLLALMKAFENWALAWQGAKGEIVVEM